MLLSGCLLVRVAASELLQASLQPVRPESDVMDLGFRMRGVGHVPGSIRSSDRSWVGDLALLALGHEVAPAGKMYPVL